MFNVLVSVLNAILSTFGWLFLILRASSIYNCFVVIFVYDFSVIVDDFLYFRRGVWYIWYLTLMLVRKCLLNINK